MQICTGSHQLTLHEFIAQSLAGRTAIFEIMVMNEEIRDCIFRRVTSQAIKEKAIHSGMVTLRQDGLEKVLKGITTLGEVMRVT